jgi:hypothetical protein
MKTIRRQEFIKLIKLHFGDETSEVCEQRLNASEAYSAMREAVSSEQMASTSTAPPLRFNSRGMDATLHEEKLPAK